MKNLKSRIATKPMIKRLRWVSRKRYLFWGLVFIIIAEGLLYYSRFLFHYRPDWFWYIEIFEFKYHLYGSLFYIALVYSALNFGWRVAFFSWLLSMAIILPRMLYFSVTPASLMTNILFLSFPLLSVAYVISNRNWRNKQARALAERERERENYMSQILRAQEDERQRIAQELHDDITQTLLVIATRVKALGRTDSAVSEATQLREELEWILGTLLTLSENVRRLSLDLRPAVLDNMGLVPALRWLADQLSQKSGVNIQIVTTGANRKLVNRTEATLFRIVQEGLNNVLQHAQAKEAVVSVEFGTETINIAVWDNGKGFALPGSVDDFSLESKWGLIGIQERVRSLRGSLHVHSEFGQGTLLSVEFSA